MLNNVIITLFQSYENFSNYPRNFDSDFSLVSVNNLKTQIEEMNYLERKSDIHKWSFGKTILISNLQIQTGNVKEDKILVGYITENLGKKNFVTFAFELLNVKDYNLIFST